MAGWLVAMAALPLGGPWEGVGTCQLLSPLSSPAGRRGPGSGQLGCLASSLEAPHRPQSMLKQSVCTTLRRAQQFQVTMPRGKRRKGDGVTAGTKPNGVKGPEPGASSVAIPRVLGWGCPPL